MKYSIILTWNKCKEHLPDNGVLCIVSLPIGVESIRGRCIGPLAVAYYCHEEKRWVYADTPSSLRFEPYYWWPLDSLLANK